MEVGVANSIRFVSVTGTGSMYPQQQYLAPRPSSAGHSLFPTLLRRLWPIRAGFLLLFLRHLLLSCINIHRIVVANGNRRPSRRELMLEYFRWVRRPRRVLVVYRRCVFRLCRYRCLGGDDDAAGDRFWGYSPHHIR